MTYSPVQFPRTRFGRDAGRGGTLDRIFRAGAASTPSSLLTGLVAWWALGEASGDRADSHTNGLTLTNNGSVGSAAGVLGSDVAASFNGTSQYLSRATESLLNPRTSDFTLALWVYPTTLSSNRTPISKSGEYTSRMNATSRPLFVVNGSGQALWGSAYTLNTWYFLVLTRDNVAGLTKVSVNDGADVTNNTQPAGTDIAASANALLIGVDSGPSNYFAGRIARVGFWSRTLTAGERTALYGAGTPPAYPFTGLP